MKMRFLRLNIIFVVAILAMSSCGGLKTAVSSSEKASPFSASEKALILESPAEVPMRVLLTTNLEDSLILRQQSQDVIPNKNDEVLTRLISRLYSTVKDSASLGVGIAAPQVGILKNVIWVQRFDKEGHPFEVYLNPKILKYTEKKQARREGCLSIPDRSDTLHSRSYAILISYQTVNGEIQIEMIENFTAIIFQDEVDHLNGILYIDHIQN